MVHGEGNPIGMYRKGEFRMTGIDAPQARVGCRGTKAGGKAKDLYRTYEQERGIWNDRD